MMSKSFTLIWFIALALFQSSCDPHRKKRCEWYLVPEPKHRHMVDQGWVSLCARNYTTRKQQCFFRAPIDFAEDIYGKPFRYTTLEFEKKPMPRKITSLQVCDPKN